MGRGEDARSKENRGQDEKTHTIAAPDGTTLEVTQREWRETYRDQGYTRAADDQDDEDEDEEETTTPEPEEVPV